MSNEKTPRQVDDEGLPEGISIATSKKTSRLIFTGLFCAVLLFGGIGIFSFAKFDDIAERIGLRSEKAKANALEDYKRYLAVWKETRVTLYEKLVKHHDLHMQITETSKKIIVAKAKVTQAEDELKNAKWGLERSEYALNDMRSKLVELTSEPSAQIVIALRQKLEQMNETVATLQEDLKKARLLEETPTDVETQATNQNDTQGSKVLITADLSQKLDKALHQKAMITEELSEVEAEFQPVLQKIGIFEKYTKQSEVRLRESQERAEESQAVVYSCLNNLSILENMHRQEHSNAKRGETKVQDALAEQHEIEQALTNMYRKRRDLLAHSVMAWNVQLKDLIHAAFDHVAEYDPYFDRLMIASETLFAPNSATLSETGKEILGKLPETIVKITNEHSHLSSWVLHIDAHTSVAQLSKQAGYESHWALSEARAKVIADFLNKSSSIDRSHFHPRGNGYYAPLSSETDQDTLHRNDRIELTLTSGPELPNHAQLDIQ